MKTIKGPAIFLAQFAADAAPFNSLQHIAHWAGSLGYKGVRSVVGRRPVRSETRRREQDLLR